MRHKDVIFLISVETDYDEIGNPIEREDERMVYANQLEVSTAEFYEASAQGLKPEKRFEIYSFEYQGEDRLKHNGQIYRVIRSATRGEKTRITCQKVIGND
ncbi:phage head closure protein [Thermoactinomyces vulgaris]|uniref:phage head closure protein n=1 Tax=Thermoactinomyces vulgaris TaxID=2026 RepID=UPI003639E403